MCNVPIKYIFPLIICINSSNMDLQLKCKTVFTFLVGKNNADSIHKLGNASISQTKTHLDLPTNMQVYFSCRERE